MTQIAVLRPDFMSVTYGVGGGTSVNTAALAEHVQACGVPALAHLTCAASRQEEIHQQLLDLRARGICNLLALRGDLAPGETANGRHYHYAAHLVAEIRAFGGFCVGGAGYPEGHVESPSQIEDLRRLKQKLDAGCAFLITQMFFDNSVLYRFLFLAQREGIDVPVLAGVMPVTNAAQITRICQLSCTSLPPRFCVTLDKFGKNPAAMAQAGIAYATEQIIDLLANGLRGVHVYTMNKPDVAAQIAGNLGAVLQSQ